MMTRIFGILGFLMLFVPSVLFSSPTETEKYIMVDQFGYRTQDKKLAILVDPVNGFNAAYDFVPGNTYEVRKWESDEVVFTGSPVPYDNLNTFTPSGDRGWWFDFSEVTEPGEYYIYDVDNQVGSYRFSIDDYVYHDVLKAAVRMYYYQRLNSPKEIPYAEEEWTDDAAFMDDNQDSDCHALWAKSDESLVRDLSGGWMDAGDVNKYVTFAENAVHQLLLAYETNPYVFTDDYNIPESGNDIPDIVDEVKYEIDWLKKMQDTLDGGVFIKMGEIDYNGRSPLSTDKRPRYYGPKCSSSSIAAAGMFAHAAIVFSEFAALSDDVNDLLKRAEMAYQWYEQNDKSSNCDSQEIKSGDADRSLEQQEQIKVVAAIYLFALTGKEEYHSVVMSRYNTLQPYVEPFWSLKSSSQGDALMYYISLDNADETVKQNIVSKRVSEGNSSDFYRNTNDLYNGYMPNWAYWWGSHSVKANVGIMNYDYLNYDIDANQHERYKDHALGILHYFHGLNPFNMVFLSNMYDYGAEKSCDEIYHTWFKDGTKWDNAVDDVGPAPGYFPGGVNIYDNPNLPIKIGNEVYNSYIPDQPDLKKYTELNNGDAPWTITEPAIYFQSPYVYLLSNFIGSDCDELLEIDGIDIEEDTVTIKRGFEGSVTASVLPKDVCNQRIIYTISNPDIADIDSKGVIKANSSGLTYIKASAAGDLNFTDSCVLEVLPCERIPYNGQPFDVPGIIEAEYYDIGCNDAFYDTDLINNGEALRDDAVDIEQCSEGGYNIGWIEQGEWLEYTVDVQSSGSYSILARVASQENKGQFLISFNDETFISDTFDVSSSRSSGWQDWQNIMVNGITLDEGQQIVRVFMINEGFNLNHVKFVEGTIEYPATPTNLTVTADDDKAILNWNDNAENEAGYIIERKSNADFSVIDTLDADLNIYTDNKVTIGTNYTYRIYAYHELLDGEYSNEASIQLVGFSNKINNVLRIFPNPSNGSVTIETDENKTNIRIALFDITGKRVYAGSHYITNNEIKLKLDVQPGIYHIRLIGNSIYSNKICIK